MILATSGTGVVGRSLEGRLRARGEVLGCLVRPASDTRLVLAGAETAVGG